MFYNIKKELFTIFNSPRNFKGDFGKFEKLYQQIKDPWNFANSPYEKKRFGIIMEFVNSIKPQSILEIGCAEGLLTKYLISVCPDITAVDISKTALLRAKQKVKGVKFILGDFTNINFNKKFSLILASEILYYPQETELMRFFNNCQTDYILIASFWNLFKKEEYLMKKFNFKKIKDKWAFRFETFIPKATYICLWKKSCVI
ncbi:MAG: SAM-dependent methyltransferase [Candidatus Humimicrobiaceae bacterium]